MHDTNILLNDDIRCDYENESKDLLKPHGDVFILNFVLVTNVPQSVIHLTMSIWEFSLFNTFIFIAACEKIVKVKINMSLMLK